MEKLITLNGVNNIVNKLVSYIKRIEAKAILEPIDWGYENANNYTTTGIYHFKGYRYTNEDNLPITNYNPDRDTDNIAFTLIVDAVEGYATDTSHIPGHISQVLMLGNRQGSETKIYTRNCTKFYDEPGGRYEWEPWSEVVTSRLLENVDINTGLNDATEIGLYTGYTVTGEVFKLEVINNYAAAEIASKQIGTVIPNHVLQTIIILSLDGSENTLNRTGVYNGSGYQWGDWKSIGGTAQVDEITIEEMFDDLTTIDILDTLVSEDDILTDENNLILTI